MHGTSYVVFVVKQKDFDFYSVVVGQYAITINSADLPLSTHGYSYGF